MSVLLVSTIGLVGASILWTVFVARKGMTRESAASLMATILLSMALLVLQIIPSGSVQLITFLTMLLGAAYCMALEVRLFLAGRSPKE